MNYDEWRLSGPDEHPEPEMTGENHPLEFIDEPPWDCTGCAGGDKWPINQEVWRCPVCDTEYHDHGATE